MHMLTKVTKTIVQKDEKYIKKIYINTYDNKI